MEHHFDSVYNEGVRERNETAAYDIDKTYCDDILDAEMSEVQIRRAIKHLKKGKAAGPDGILSEMLKTAEPESLQYFKKYFDVMFVRGQLPVEWSKTIIVPLHKKGLLIIIKAFFFCVY